MCVLAFENPKITLSTTEAEYVALASTIKEAMFLRHMWSFIFPGFGTMCITVFKDNEGAKNLAQNPVCTSNSKHIDVRRHFLPEFICKGEFVITSVESDDKHADVLTKPPDYTAFCYRRDFLMNI